VWNITEIGYALELNEAIHSSNFFKKHADLSPSKYSNS